MRGFPLHMFKTFVVERENDGAREEGVSSGVAALSRMICYFLFLFYFLLIYPFIITNFSQQKETGLGSGEGRTCMSALGLQRSESTVYININFFFFFLKTRSPNLKLPVGLQYRDSPEN